MRQSWGLMIALQKLGAKWRGYAGVIVDFFKQFLYKFAHMSVAHEQLRNLLKTELRSSKSRNRAFSARAFSRRLGISSGGLSAILSGKRRVSSKYAVRILDRLNVQGERRARIERLFGKENSDSLEQAAFNVPYRELSSDQFELIRSWEHFAILNLTRIPDVGSDPHAIAKRLGISRRQAQNAMTRLVRLGMLEILPDGKMIRREARYKTSDGQKSEALRYSHAKNLKLAARSLKNDPIEIRDFLAMTVAINPNRIDQARLIIRKAFGELCDLLEEDPVSEVYKACFQLFPLSHSGEVNDQK